MSNIQQSQKSKSNPMGGFIGFIVLVILAGLSYAVSDPVLTWLQTTNLPLGSTGIKLLPIKFPADWPRIASQLAVSGGLFLVVFVVTLLVLFTFMRPAETDDETTVSIADIKRERASKKRR